MNKRNVGLLVTVAAILGTPTTASAQTQPSPNWTVPAAEVMPAAEFPAPSAQAPAGGYAYGDEPTPSAGGAIAPVSGSIEYASPTLKQPQPTPINPSVQPTNLIAQPPTAFAEPELQQKLLQLEQQQQQLRQEIESLRQTLANQKPFVYAAKDNPPTLEIWAQPIFMSPSLSTPLDYAIADPGGALAVTGDLKSVEYDNTVALRIGLTYRLPNSGWDILGSYTFLSTDASSSAVSPPNGFLFSTIAHPFQNETADTASASADLDYNGANLEAGYTFKVGQSFDVRLFGGLQYANVERDFRVNYDGRDFTNSQIKISNDFSGVGPRLGLEGRVNLGSGFSLFGRGAGGLLIGDASYRYRETDRNGADLVASLKRNQSGQTVPVVDMAAGVEWKTAIDETTQINLSAGYEYQQLFNVGNNFQFVDAASPGVFSRSNSNLTLKGFFVKGGISVMW